MSGKPVPRRVILCAPHSRPFVQIAPLVSRPRRGVANAAHSPTVRHLYRPPSALVCEEPPALDARRGQKTRALSRHQRLRVSAMPGRTHLCGGNNGVRARTALRPVREHMVDLPAPVQHPPQAAHSKVTGNRAPPIRRSPKVPARAQWLTSLGLLEIPCGSVLRVPGDSRRTPPKPARPAELRATV